MISLTPSQVWLAWFGVIAIPGAIMEVGLQSELGLAWGWGFAAMCFVVAVALGVAEIMERVTLIEESSTSSFDDFGRANEVPSSQGGNWSNQGESTELQEQIDDELNGSN